MKARFQKAFEAKFTPLPQVEFQIEPEQQDGMDDISEDETDIDELDGLSDVEETIQVIKHDQSQSDSQIDQAHERRIFMVRHPSKYVTQACTKSNTVLKTTECWSDSRELYQVKGRAIQGTFHRESKSQERSSSTASIEGISSIEPKQFQK